MFPRLFWVGLFTACFFACAAPCGHAQSLSPPDKTAKENGAEEKSQAPTPDLDQLEKKVKALDKQNADLKARIDQLQKEPQSLAEDGPKTSPPPRSTENSSSPIIEEWGVVITSIGVVFTLLAVFFAAYTIWRSSAYKESILAEARKETAESQEALARFARAISHSAVGTSFFKLAWSPAPYYLRTTFSHLADESIKYNKKAFDYCRDSTRHHKQFASEMNDVKWRSLNNMLFCVALQKEDGVKHLPEAADYARELRNESPLLDHPIWINTYCLFVLTFLDDFALLTNQSRSTIFEDLDLLCRRQELTPISRFSPEEFAKIKNMLLAAKGQISSSS